MPLDPIKIRTNVPLEEVDDFLAQPNVHHSLTCHVVSYREKHPRVLFLVDNVVLDLSVEQLEKIIARIKS